MDARETIRAYYEALRAGDQLPPFFAAEAGGDDPFVKFGIAETLRGSESIAAGLREQSATTTDWHVDSRALSVTQREHVAWFADEVGLEWTDTGEDQRRSFDTRWSGTLERRLESTDAAPGDWRFVGMHVSVPGEM